MINTENFPGFKKIGDRWIAIRAVFYPKLSPNRLNRLLKKSIISKKDIETLKDYKWMLLFDHQTGIEKGFYFDAFDSSMSGYRIKDIFWLTNINNAIARTKGE